MTNEESVRKFLEQMDMYLRRKRLTVKEITELYPEFVKWWDCCKDNLFLDIGFREAFILFEAGYILRHYEEDY